MRNSEQAAAGGHADPACDHSAGHDPTSDVGGDPPDTPTALEDWERRIYRRVADDSGIGVPPELDPPAAVRAQPGAGHVRLSWDAVPAAAGYLIGRGTVDDPRPRVLRHGGSDVFAIPGTSFADTGIEDGVDYVYRIGAVAGPLPEATSWSEPVTARTAAGPAGDVRVDVDASSVTGELQRVWYMVGSERLTQLRFGDDGNGNDIGTEFRAALRRAHDDLGVTHVRAHAILHDDNAVVSRDADGSLAYDFSRVDALYDDIIGLGVRPIVELSFMPAELARDPQQTVFEYRGIISPPRVWSEWHDLVRALTAHLVDRYGADEVRQWGFEVWNEPNLSVFWTGTPAEYLRLYHEATLAVKSVDDALPVGGPASSAGEWLDKLAAYAADNDLPLDFLASHTYGNLPLDVRPGLARHGLDKIPVWWTEWGVGSTHFGPIHDGVIGAPFMLSGYSSVQGRMQAVAYWVVSDHFEELGRPPKLFHNGFGLQTVGNLRKPRYWAANLAAHQGDHVLASKVTGDGAAVLVQSWATRHDDGSVDVLVWNGTINGQLMRGDPRLDRHVAIRVGGLTEPRYTATVARIDEHHSNVVAHCPPGLRWPDAAQWNHLRAHDELHVEELPDVAPTAGHAGVDVDLPMPGVARLRLTPSNRSTGTDEETAR